MLQQYSLETAASSVLIFLVTLVCWASAHISCSPCIDSRQTRSALVLWWRIIRQFSWFQFKFNSRTRLRVIFAQTIARMPTWYDDGCWCCCLGSLLMLAIKMDSHANVYTGMVCIVLLHAYINIHTFSLYMRRIANNTLLQCCCYCCYCCFVALFLLSICESVVYDHGRSMVQLQNMFGHFNAHLCTQTPTRRPSARSTPDTEPE